MEKNHLNQNKIRISGTERDTVASMQLARSSNLTLLMFKAVHSCCFQAFKIRLAIGKDDR